MKTKQWRKTRQNITHLKKGIKEARKKKTISRQMKKTLNKKKHDEITLKNK